MGRVRRHALVMATGDDPVYEGLAKCQPGTVKGASRLVVAASPSWLTAR